MEKELLDEDIVTLDGFITLYKFESEDQYRIANFKIDDNKQERTITIVGYFPHFEKNDALSLKGKMINHKKYGLQVEVLEIYKKLPTSRSSIIRFLSSSTFKGVGEKTATAIVEYLGDEAITIMINDHKIFDNLVHDKIIKEKVYKKRTIN